MKLLVINPNTTDAITEILNQRAVDVAAPRTEIIAKTAPFGVDYIKTPEDGAVSIDAIRQLIQEHHNTIDAAVICSSSDSGLQEMRGEFDIPITAMTESSLRLGSMLGKSGCLLVYLDFGIEDMTLRAEKYGMSWFLKSVRIPIKFDGGIPPDPSAFKQACIDETRRAIEEDGVDVVIPCGSAAAHLTIEIARETDVHVLEGVSCGVKSAEALVGLQSKGLAGPK